MSVASYVSPDLKGKIGTSSRPVRRLIFKKFGHLLCETQNIQTEELQASTFITGSI